MDTLATRPTSWRHTLCSFLLVLAGLAAPAYAAEVQLAWDANTESDLAGYIVLIGTQSGVYTQSMEVAPSTPQAEVSSLATGATYYFAVRAFNTAGLQSGLSNEVSVALGPVLLPAPAITTVSPASGSVSGGTVVTISGTNFTSGDTVRFGGTTAAVSSVSATSIVATAPAGVAGAVAVSVTNPDGQVANKASAFTFVANPPAITGFSPSSAMTTGGTLVTLTGAHFTSGAVVRFGTTPATVQSVSASSIVVVSPVLVAGAVPVSVTLSDGQSATADGTFTVLAPTPMVEAVSPASSSTLGGTTVTISGQQFLAGASVLFGSQPAAVTAVTATTLTVIAPPQAAGLVGVSVINPGGSLGTKPNAFTYIASAPALSGVSPASGPTVGGNTVVVSGEGFGPGTAVVFGGVAAPVVTVSPTALSVLAPAGLAGVAAVIVQNSDGQTATMTGAYTYEASAPGLSGLSPATGPEAGGSVVTLSGAHFVNGASVMFGGQAAVVNSLSGTQIVVTTPARSHGAVDVTVQNPDGLTTTLGNAFTYDAPAPPMFVRYFAEGVQSGFFTTRFALANPHQEAVVVQVTFTDSFGQESPMMVDVPAGGRATIDRSKMPVITGDAFATKFESDREVAIDRTVVWDAGTPYGGHSETGIEAPRTTWHFAEGATHSGFSLFYLLQNPGDQTAEVLVRYMLGTGQVVEKVHYVAARARTNIWVNQDDPALVSAEVSAQLRSLNGVPFVAERSMYQSVNGQLFTSGTNSGAVAEPATRWFLAEGATGDYFDTFVLVSNPNPTAATLQVTYLLPQGSPLQLSYTVPANSRYTIWLDQQHNRLRKTDVSVIVTSTNGVPVVVERTMWWPGTVGGAWTEAHSSAGATSSASRWVMADGLASSANGTTTYALVANTASAKTLVRFTLLTAQGRGRSVQHAVSGNSRFSIDVATTFPEARDTSFGLLVESLDGAPLVVERSTYWDAGGIRWAGGTNALAMPLH